MRIILFALFILFLNVAHADDFSSMGVDQLYDSDQIDRKVQADKIDWDQVIPRDQERQNRVLELLRSNKIIDAQDFWKAAIVMQHGQTIEDIKIAYSLATLYYEKSPREKRNYWIVAATWDRIMVQSKMPQWYGTQYIMGPKGGWELYDIHKTQISDAQRKELGLKTLPEIQEDLRKLNLDDK